MVPALDMDIHSPPSSLQMTSVGILTLRNLERGKSIKTTSSYIKKEIGLHTSTLTSFLRSAVSISERSNISDQKRLRLHINHQPRKVKGDGKREPAASQAVAGFGASSHRHVRPRPARHLPGAARRPGARPRPALRGCDWRRPGGPRRGRGARGRWLPASRCRNADSALGDLGCAGGPAARRPPPAAQAAAGELGGCAFPPATLRACRIGLGEAGRPWPLPPRPVRAVPVTAGPSGRRKARDRPLASCGDCADAPVPAPGDCLPAFSTPGTKHCCLSRNLFSCPLWACEAEALRDDERMRLPWSSFELSRQEEGSPQKLCDLPRSQSPLFCLLKGAPTGPTGVLSSLCQKSAAAPRQSDLHPGLVTSDPA
ncbi:uncharacterized protein LOC130680474 [Manis pentadactyla]|uniref:uncharacterized protein LOC130680474 n=1 Tax=Manis pentadactyla TaxID=143292 RepID=UPI00255CAA69|nr:uncharacterized protein LOC130680474 [Manis pentadactyla]